MKLPVKQALVCWLAGAMVSAGLLHLFCLCISVWADDAVKAAVYLVAPTGLAALFTWMTVRKRTTPASWGTFVFIYVGWYLAMLVIASLMAAYV